MSENSLKDIFLRNRKLWQPIFHKYMNHEEVPNFSVYRKPFEQGVKQATEQLLHILYMKSTAKALSRNYNAQDLELFCSNRFYGPLVVAFNLNKPPYYLQSFSLKEYEIIRQHNLGS